MFYLYLFSYNFIKIYLLIILYIYIYYINSLVCACVRDHWTHRLCDGKKKSDSGRRMHCVRLFEPWNPGSKTEVLKPKSLVLFRRAAQG
jgi:hypothetical protein